MAALVSSEGRLRVANQAFLLRALGEGDAVHYAGRDVAPMIRLDDAGALYFAREGDRATPVRLIQIPLAPADRNTPMLLALIDEEMGPHDRGTARSEENKSEPTSLMRNSIDRLCLQNTTTTHHGQDNT